MKNLKIYSIIILFAMGIMLISCAGEPVESTESDTTAVDNMSEGLTDEDAAFEDAMDEIASEGLDDSTLELDGLKDFNDAISGQDFDKALVIYQELIDTYADKLNTLAEDDAEATQELNEISKTLSQISMSIFENRAALSKEQTTLYNTLEVKFQKIDKK